MTSPVRILLLFVFGLGLTPDAGAQRVRFCFPFDGDFWDQSGNGYFASPARGVPLVADRHGNAGKAIKLDGGRQQFLNLNKPIPDQTAYTLMAWVKLNDLLSGGTLFCDADVPSGNDLIWSISSSFMGIRCDKAPSNLWQWPNGIPLQLDTNWHHMAWTSDGVANRVFLDGVRIHSVSATSRNIGFHARRPTIGSLWLDDSISYARYGYLSASLDDFMLFDEALTPDQVLAYYQGGNSQPTLQETILCDLNGSVTLRAPAGSAYRWTDSLGNVLGNDSVLTITPQTGSTLITATVAANLSCRVGLAQFRVRYRPTDFVLTSDVYRRPCRGDSAILNTVPWDTYFWSTGDIGRQITATQSGTYTAERRVPGCPARRQSIVLDLPPYPVPDYLPTELALCLGQAELSCEAPDSVAVRWTLPDGGTRDTCRFVPSLDGLFTAEYTTPQGCRHTEQVLVEGLEQANLAFDFVGPDGSLIAPGQVAYAHFPVALKLVPQEPRTRLLWTYRQQAADDSVLLISMSQPGRVEATLSLPGQQCIPPVSETIELRPILLPNVITDNGDQLNDGWPLRPDNANTAVSTTLYNRYGTVVYEGDAPTPGEIRALLPGIYFHKTTLTAFGAEQVRKGWVEVVR